MDMRLPPLAPRLRCIDGRWYCFGEGYCGTGLTESIAWASWEVHKQFRKTPPATDTRARMLALSGGYSGARIDRSSLVSWRTRAGGPATDVITDLPMLRQRARDLERNAPVAAGAINTTTTHVVGTGLACLPQIDGEFLGLDDAKAEAWQSDVRRRLYAWAETPDCDLARVLDFYGLQDLALRGVLASGDVFVLTPRIARESGPARLALQVIEADRCCNPDDKRNAEGLTDGIQHSSATGEAVRYWFCDQHPGDVYSPNRTWTPVDARGQRTGRRNVLHLFKQLRPGLRRGVPILAPVIEPLKQLARYTEAELQAAVTAGLFSVFIKMDPSAFADLFEEGAEKTYLEKSGNWTGEIESGKAINLLPGEEVESVNPARPNAEFDPFVTACIRQIGMALGMPYEVLVMHYQSSYSAARGALLMAWRFFGGWRAWLATYLCQPVYELWLTDEIAEGRIAAAGFFADPVVRAAWCGAQWVGDGPGSIDPVKEVGAAEKRVALGISTLAAESLLHDGIDWTTKHRQTTKEAAARGAVGLAVPGAAPPAPAAAEPRKPKPNSEARQQASDDLTRALTALALREPAPPHVTVTSPPISIAPPAITVEAPQINVTVPEREVSIAPAAVTVHAPEIVVQSPAPRHIERIPERDDDGNIVRVIERDIE